MSIFERQDFIDQANSVIRNFGGIPREDAYHWRLKTRLGLLRLHVNSDLNGFGIGVVYTQFDDSRRAACEVDCNGATGDWNHYYTDWTVKEAIDDFIFWIRRVMP